MKVKNFNKTIYKLIIEGIVFLFSFIWMIVNSIMAIPNLYIVSIMMFFLSTVLVFYLEKDYFKTYKQLKDFSFTMDFLIALSTHITYLASIVLSIVQIAEGSIFDLTMQFWEVGFSLSFFIGIGHYLENKIKVKTSLGIKDLLKLQQKNALVFDEKNNIFSSIKHNEIKKGMIIKILKGQSIPTDGILISKNAILDCSSLLGESLPRNLKENNEVLSGMINLSDELIYKCTKTSNESALNSIINQLENILKNKSNIERISEKIVKWFLPIVVLIFLITFIVWLTLSYLNIKLDFFHVDQIDYSNPFAVAINHAVAVLVISCPCAFGIAAPAAIYSSSGLASKHKILFSSASVYEKMNKINFIAFDKTGTLTNGQLKVIEQIGVKKYNDIILSMTSNSNHLISQSISNFLKDNNFLKMEIKEIEGYGILSNYKNQNVFLGSIKYCQKNNFVFDIEIKNTNKVVAVFAINQHVVTYFVLEDTIKENALNTISKIKEMNIIPMIISGDRKEVVHEISQKLNIENFYYNQLPIEKQEILKKYHKNIFVGDGINDVLAIKEADVSIAFSSGSDITNSIADISLLDKDISLVYKSIVLCKKTIKVIKFNFIWAAIFNLIFIPLAIIGIVPVWIGAAIMTLSNFVLLINNLL